MAGENNTVLSERALNFARTSECGPYLLATAAWYAIAALFRIAEALERK